MKSFFSRRFLSALTLVGVGLTTSCAFGPGDYKVYTIAVAAEVVDPACPDAGDPEDVAMDVDTYLASGTYYVFAGPEDIFYLDNGVAVLEGMTTDGGFEFSGQSVDVEVNGPQTTTSETRTLVTFNVDGKAVSGTAVTTISYSCTGDGCGDNTTCTRTSPFVGSEIDGVDIEHQI